MGNIVSVWSSPPLVEGTNKTYQEYEEAYRKMRFKSRVEQAEFVDEVCNLNARNPEFLKKNFATEDIENPRFDEFDARSVGNLAFLAMHAPAPYRAMAQSLLNRYLYWEEEQETGQRIIPI